MGFWSRLARTLRADRRNRYEDEIDEEIRFHLAMKAREGQNAREARLRFGHPDAIRQDTRAAGILQGLESLLQDARYGLRQLRRTPALTLAIVLSVTIGIGANTAIFSLVDAALIKPLPVPDPGSLVVVHWSFKGWPARSRRATTAARMTIRRATRSFRRSGLSCIGGWRTSSQRPRR